MVSSGQSDGKLRIMTERQVNRGQSAVNARVERGQTESRMKGV